MNRRQCNRVLLGGTLGLALNPSHTLLAATQKSEGSSHNLEEAVHKYSNLVHWWQDLCKGPRPKVPTKLTKKEDDAFLEDIERRAFRFFWEQGDAHTGLVLDRARADGSPVVGHSFHVASIASTGFGLTALCIGASRGWITQDEARDRVRATLRFFADRATQVHGWYYHFLDSATGERKWNCELSSIDTALLLGGILTARQKFPDDSEIVRTATRIYNRVDFPWMCNQSTTLLSMGWRPETGFIRASWNMYAEETMLYLLGIGSPTHPLPAESWHAWKRTWTDYAGFRFLNFAPLFSHQYSHAWIDYRNRFEPNPPYVNYFINSIAATLANRAFCMQLSRRFPGYGPNVWGITASDSAHGYTAWGTVPVVDHIDGTVVPCAAGGSLMFTPEICVAALSTMKRNFGEGQLHGKPIWGRYGFVDSFNPNTGWVDTDVLGIDLGITLLSAENARTGNVWRWFMANPEPVKALEMVGLRRRRPAPQGRQG
ncbi:MAG: glucoamylase family protein [Terriglobia bacterium]